MRPDDDVIAGTGEIAYKRRAILPQKAFGTPRGADEYRSAIVVPGFLARQGMELRVEIGEPDGNYGLVSESPGLFHLANRLLLLRSD